MMAKFAAVAEFTPTRLLRKAISTAAALAQGEMCRHWSSFRINVTDSLATPAIVKAHAIQWKEAKEASGEREEVGLLAALSTAWQFHEPGRLEPCRRSKSDGRTSIPVRRARAAKR